MSRRLAAVLAVALLSPLPAGAEPYVTPASAHRWSTAAGIRFNDAGGIRFNDAGGIRFNDVGGIRFNDAGGILITDASGIRFNDAGGIRFNDAGGVSFEESGRVTIGLPLLDLISFLPDTSSLNVVVSYRQAPQPSDLDALRSLGVTGGTIFRRLPMVAVAATRSQIAAIAALPTVRSVWADRMLTWVGESARSFIGADQAEADPALRAPPGLPFAGRGVTIAFVDTGIDATHPDLPAGSKVTQNARMEPGGGLPGVFAFPVVTENHSNTDVLLGHGTFAAGVAAGSGAAGGGLYRGVAPEAKLVGVSVGDVYIVNVLEGFDYILWKRAQYGIRVVNCSFATTGPFDPDDPVNIATRILHDEGLTVVFAAGNYGPAPDTLSPYAVAPWVIGVSSGDAIGRLSDFSSRGIPDEGLYHPTLTAPGERVVSTSSVSLQGVFGVSGAPASSKGEIPAAHQWAYSEASGTSFAAPHVAGVAALLLEAVPGLSPSDIKRLLQATATPMPARQRGEAGAGYLDAWAALTAALHPDRPFGGFIAEMLDERRGRHVYGPMTGFSGTVPVNGAATLPVPGGDAAVALWAGIAWGMGADDLDITVVDSDGRELARAGSINAPGLFGSSEGIVLYHPGTTATLRITSKGPLAADRPFEGQWQAIGVDFPELRDLEGLTSGDRAAALRALDALALVPRSAGPRDTRRRRTDGADATSTECFCGGRVLQRQEAARLVAMAAHIPQTIPGVRTFNDVPESDPSFTHIESVANPGARRGVVLAPRHPNVFGATDAVTRIGLAVAALDALGLGDEAASWDGTLDVADASELPPGTAGYAALAISLGILGTSASPEGEALRPNHAITRIESAHAAVAILNARR